MTNSPAPSVSQHLQVGMEYHQAGNLPQAEAIYRGILQTEPNHPGALHFLGLIARQTGKIDAAIELIGKSLKFKPDYAEAHNNLGNALKQQGRLDEAIASYRRALKLKPDFAEAYGNLGNALREQGEQGDREKSGKLDDAVANYRKAILLKPDFAEMHSNLGNALRDQGKLDEAISSYRRAVALKPEFAEAHSNLGNVLNEQGKPEDAASSFRKALTFRPDFAEAHSNLGNALREMGRLEEAVASYRRSLACNPGYAPAFANLGSAQREQGKLDEAIISYCQALQISESTEIKTGFAQCIRNLYFTHEIPNIRPLVARAISEPWGRPAELANPAISLIKLDPAIKPCLDRAVNAWPARLSLRALLGDAGLHPICNDALLRCLLENTPVCDLELERLLTTMRHNMLDAAMHTEHSSLAAVDPAIVSGSPANAPAHEVLAFYCALARQCFINEYVFASPDEEMIQARVLKNRLAAALVAGLPVPPLWLPAVAAYFPLISLIGGELQENTLLDRSWPDAVAALLVQQIREPLEEQRYRPLIPHLTSVADHTSRLVQKQYEENPYPRWIKLPPLGRSMTVGAYLRNRFPVMELVSIDDSLEAGGPVNILIAGCGTGQHAITTAQRYQDAKVLAIDLSLTSLCYAKRKTCDLGLRNIDYAQADIMNLEPMGSTESVGAAGSARSAEPAGSAEPAYLPGLAGEMFDIVEAVGVLHHLADPLAGWRKLLALLRPDGFMRLGFYSACARQNETAARQFISARGYGSNLEDIRRCRQDLAAGENAVRFRQILSARDFYTTSECRDLLFHVQEHCFTLPQLKDNLRELDLVFIGFSLDVETAKRYSKQFPSDPLQTDLDNWHIFETANPETFTSMYQFWVQKRR